MVNSNTEDILYEGSCYRILYCKGAKKSLEQAMSHVSPSSKQRQFKIRLMLQIKRLADGNRLSKENFPQEGNLPDGKKFNAFKRIPIRGYCWKSSKYPNTYFISHFIYKDQQKLNRNDTDKVCKNWKQIEK